MILNLATILTISRIIFIQIVVFCYTYSDGEIRNIAAFIFLIALVTDYFDGLVARKFNQETPFGAFLDPIADKLLVVVTILLLSRTFDSILFLIPSLIIVSREFLVIAIRQRLAEVGENIKLSVILISKIKTAIQLISLLLLLYKYPFLGYDTYLYGTILLQISAILTLISFFYYVKKSWNVIIK